MITIEKLADLDYAVAEHVMGWQHWQFTRSDGSTYVQFTPPGNEAYAELLKAVKVDAGDDLKLAPSFSTDPAASYALRQKMRESDWASSQWDELDNGNRVVVASFHKLHYPMGTMVVFSHANEFIAICLAALRALGVELDLREGWDAR